MTKLLEIRDYIKKFYAQNEVFIIPVIKFILAFIVLSQINSRLGYMAKIDKTAYVLLASLVSCILPNGVMIFFAAVFSLLHMYKLSMEVALVGLALYLILFILFFRFNPRESLLLLITPVLFACKLPYAVPIAAGLLYAPPAIVSACCGVVVYYFLQLVNAEAQTINTMGDGETLAKIRLIIDAIIANKEMVVYCGAFTVTILVVYFIRKLAVDYSWSIAMAAGAIVNIVVLLVGDLKFDTNLSVGGVIFGSILAVLIAKVIEFFRFCVDYSRTEKVQFEDDEYYYYVKAVPKMSVPAKTKTVKKINSNSRTERRVFTERTERADRRKYDTDDFLSGATSVTVGTAGAYSEDDAQYDEGYDGQEYSEDEVLYDEDGNPIVYSGDEDYVYEDDGEGGGYADEDGVSYSGSGDASDGSEEYDGLYDEE